MHEKHKGHEAMHLEMILILLVTLIIAQIALVEWKKRHYRSYSVTIHNAAMTIINRIQKSIRSTANYIAGTVDNTGCDQHSKSMVAIRYNLVHIHVHQWHCNEKSGHEAGVRHNAETRVQVVQFDIQN